MNNSDMPVTPIFNSNGKIQAFTDDEGFSLMATGLTKREAFAMAAMQGILSHSFGRGNPEECAIAALQNADALLKELEK